MIRKLLIAGIVMVPVAALAGSSSPPPPQPATCAGGNSVTALGYGIATTCGTATANGAINDGVAGNIAQYTAQNTVGPASPALVFGGALTTTQALTTTGTGAITLALGNSVATLTFQGTDTYVGRATTDTLTNKTLTSPVLVTPALGTPASGVATNLTGLPIATGVSGLGTGAATALAINTGSAGAFAKNNGDALSGTFSGTPTWSGIPKFTGLSAGTIASGKNLGLDSSNNLVTATAPGGSGTIASTTSALAGDGAGNAVAVTGTGTNCVLVNGSSGACGSGSGTVTSITAGNGISTGGSAITTTGTISTTNTTNSQSGATYTILLGDGGKSVWMTNGSATTVTVTASGTLGAGFQTVLVCDAGCTVARSGSDTFNGAATSIAVAAHEGLLLQADGGTNFKAFVLANVNPLALANTTGTLAVANGGTGTASPGLVQGTNVTITGSWPNQTINSSGGGGGGGAVTWISTCTISSSTASCNWTSLTLDNYKLVCWDGIPVTSTANLMVQFSTDNGSTYISTGYDENFWVSTGAGVDLTNQPGLYLSSESVATAPSMLQSETLLTGLATSGAPHTARTSLLEYSTSAGPLKNITASGWLNGNTTPVNALQVKFSSGNIAKIKCALYSMQIS